MQATTLASVLILGTDAVLAGAPATPVQLAHACLSAGYRMVVPSSWGDELVAARSLERIAQSESPLVQTSCPHVTRRLAPNADAIAPMLMCLVPPPVAAAAYLRALYAPARAHITFAGQCPAGSHSSIDAWLSPDELLASLLERGITLAEQPTEFDSVLTPDRRRFYSEPGGGPAQQAIATLDVPVQLVESESDDLAIEIAQHLLSESRMLLLPAARLGCTCRGVVPGVTPRAARARILELEPPRAAGPVVDHTIPLVLDAAIEVEPGAKAPLPQPPLSSPMRARRTPESTEPVPDEVSVAVEATPRRRSPPTTPRPVLGAVPLARKDAGGGAGRHLPRAYIARRRSSPRGVRKLGAMADKSTATARPAWQWIALAGVGAGLALAWLLGLAG